jgi:hypothetical protein
MVSVDYFRRELQAQMGRATKGGLLDVMISSGELYRFTWWLPWLYGWHAALLRRHAGGNEVRRYLVSRADQRCGDDSPRLFASQPLRRPYSSSQMTLLQT